MADLKKNKKLGSNGLPEHTPLMRQWLTFKDKVGEMMLFYRVGDFYELFWEDAEKASKLLDIVLTRRGESGGKPVVMSGIPYHALDLHLSRLVKLGVSAAVVDQIGDPSKSIGPVERAIARIVTPGTLVDDALLSDRKDAPLLSCMAVGDKIALFWTSLSSGDSKMCIRPVARLADELERIAPAEILCPEGFDVHRQGSLTTKVPAWHFDVTRGETALKAALDTPSLSAYGVDVSVHGAAIAAAAAALEHIKSSMGGKAPKLARLSMSTEGSYLRMDAPTRKSLEIDGALHGAQGASLVSSLDLCSCPMGSRRLREWIGSPLTDLVAIRERHVAVEALLIGQAAQELDFALKGYPDTERAGARAAAMASRPRDFSNLRQAFERLPDILNSIKESKKHATLLANLERAAKAPEDLLSFLSTAIEKEPSVNIRDGGVIAKGFNAELDELRSLSVNAEEAMAEMERRERENTGIPTLRLDYNKLHGFSIEITRTHAAKVPEHYRRKMTLKNTERYTTDELTAFEMKVLSARERSLSLEKELFEQCQVRLSQYSLVISSLSFALSCLDALGAFARAAKDRGYCKPIMLEGQSRVESKGLRHAVAEIALGAEFIPNDVQLDQQRRCLVVTGPNMGGKSTYMRSLALACIMAQAGSFVAADAFASTATTDMFARVGASDDINKGQSTFMVEMTEAAAILRTANPHSICIIDEIGRGTSTFDGMSLAWAILRHLHDINGALCLFSTHYFELTDLAKRLAQCDNAHMGASFENGSLRFLRKLLPGAASQSHGIHVAKLAGVPEIALQWSKSMLTELEKAEASLLGQEPYNAIERVKEPELDLKTQRILASLEEANPDEMTPKQAHDALCALRALLK